MKYVLSFVSGVLLSIIAVVFTFSTGKVALVSHDEYSGNGPAYLHSGSIDPRCSMTTYTTWDTTHRNIIAYSSYQEHQVAGGALITRDGNQKPLVMLWDDSDGSVNNMFHQITPILKKSVSKNNNASIACLGEAKVNKSNWGNQPSHKKPNRLSCEAVFFLYFYNLL